MAISTSWATWYCLSSDKCIEVGALRTLGLPKKQEELDKVMQREELVVFVLVVVRFFESTGAAGSDA